MEVPSPEAGRVTALHVKEGDRVSEGDVIATIEAAGGEAEADEPKVEEAGEVESRKSEGKEAPAPTKAAPDGDLRAEVVVLGSGPGGYTAAFRAADLGRDVILIERYPSLGGVCPQRRLHPFEGALARRQGHHRGRRDGRPRRVVRQAEGRGRAPARLEGLGGREAHGGLSAWPSSATSASCRASVASPAPTRSKSRARTAPRPWPSSSVSSPPDPRPCACPSCRTTTRG